MSPKLLTPIFLLAIAAVAQAQEISWASKVEKFSSQTGTKNYSANQVLGKPNASHDSTGNGWQPVGSNKEEFIIVSFDNVVKTKQIFIVESMNTGYIRRVSAFSEDGLEYNVAAYPPKSGAKGPKLVSINVSEFNINVKSVKIVMVPLRNVSTTIDAVGISSSDTPYSLNKVHHHLEMVAVK
jgi:hypothetical protein